MRRFQLFWKLLHRLPSPLRNLVYAFGTWIGFREHKRVRKLDIEEQGIDEHGLPYLKLQNNALQFWGYPTENEFKALYRWFTSRHVKKKIDELHYQIACDIAFRYLIPDEAPLYRGKYYDFQPGDVVVEVGAYTGYYAMRVAELTGETGKVIAIEAIPENFDILKKNVEHNHLHQIIPVHKAVWHTKGTLQLHHMSNQRASVSKELVATQGVIDVACDTIDNILESLAIQKVDFVRIQVNTAEAAVLEGMTTTLTYGPRLLIAVPYNINGVPASNVIANSLKEKGYISEIYGGSLFAYPETDADNVDLPKRVE